LTRESAIGSVGQLFRSRYEATMAQHFLLSAAARTISLGQVLRMTDAEAEASFAALRWPETAGRPMCPSCTCPICYDCRRPTGGPRWRCKACRRDFSLTSGTLFAFHKLSLREYLAAIVLFCNEVKGKAALALSRALAVQDKTAFVLAHKIREALGLEFRERQLGGADRHVEVDGAYFGGHVRPAHRKADRQDRRLAENQTGKRQVVVVIRERARAGLSLGATLPAVFASEDKAIDFIKARVDRAATVHADEAPAWNALHARFDTRRINHAVEYANDEACTNHAEAFFARARRGEIGHFHHISGVYLLRYARELAWKEDHRRTSNGEPVRRIVALVAASRPSIDFCGYWQRHRAV
jgi:transposase-like protein